MDVTSINIIIGGLIGVTGALLGSIINGISNYKNSQIQFNREQNKLQLIKLEELYELLLECEKDIFWFGSRVYEYSKISPDNEHFREITEIITKTNNKVETMTAFYAPSLYSNMVEISKIIVSLQGLGIGI